MPKSNRLHDPEELGKYVVTEEIAEGTFGKVKSQHPSFNPIVHS
jgi:hypothetical protein